MYYLQDHATAAILFIHKNPYIVNNLKSGILDCYSFSFSDYGTTVEKIQEHSNKITNETGIRIVPPSIEEFSLDNYPEIARKQELIKIRASGFEELLACSEQYRNRNSYGFHPIDPIVIKEMLENQNRIEDYATVMGISPEFAKTELDMIVNSTFIDQFKIFTVCNLWKQRINTCEDQTTMQRYIGLIKQSFSSIPDIPNV
jgi:hypothetical protein